MFRAVLALALALTFAGSGTARADDSTYQLISLLVNASVQEQLGRVLEIAPTENVPDGRARTRFFDLRPAPLPNTPVEQAEREIDAARQLKAKGAALAKRHADLRYAVRAALVPAKESLAELMPVALKTGMPREGDVVALTNGREVRIAWLRVGEDGARLPDPPVAVSSVPPGADLLAVLDAQLTLVDAPRAAWFSARDARRGGTAQSELIPLAVLLIVFAVSWPMTLSSEDAHSPST